MTQVCLKNLIYSKRAFSANTESLLQTVTNEFLEQFTQYKKKFIYYPD